MKKLNLILVSCALFVSMGLMAQNKTEATAPSLKNSSEIKKQANLKGVVKNLNANVKNNAQQNAVNKRVKSKSTNNISKLNKNLRFRKSEIPYRIKH